MACLHRYFTLNSVNAKELPARRSEASWEMGCRTAAILLTEGMCLSGAHNRISLQNVTILIWCESFLCLVAEYKLQRLKAVVHYIKKAWNSCPLSAATLIHILPVHLWCVRHNASRTKLAWLSSVRAKGRGPCRHPLGLDLSQSCLSVDSESPQFGCTWLRSVSRGRAHLKPNLLTVPRQAIFENNLEKVGLQGRVLLDFALSRLYNKAARVGFSRESVTEQRLLNTLLYNWRSARHFKAGLIYKAVM